VHIWCGSTHTYPTCGWSRHAINHTAINGRQEDNSVSCDVVDGTTKELVQLVQMEHRLTVLEALVATLTRQAARLLWDPATQPNKFEAASDDAGGVGVLAGTPANLLALRAEHVALRTTLVTTACALTRATTARRKGSTSANPGKALLRAATDGQLGLIQELLHSKAVHVDQVGSGRSTALHMAVQQNRLLTVQLLLESKANINVQNGKQSTPLMVAAATAPGLVSTLLAAGADPNMLNAVKANAFTIASEAGHMHVAALLEPVTTSHVATVIPAPDGRSCHLCGEPIRVVNLTRIKARVDAGEEENQHIIDFVRSAAYQPLVDDARFHRATTTKSLRESFPVVFYVPIPSPAKSFLWKL
jgi:hypothetical protein